MRNWDDLKFCLALARHGTMSAAATYLDTNVATVSRRIAKLTAEMGETLFIKDYDGWRATPAAEEIVELAETIEQEIGGFRHDDVPPRGTTIRISADLSVIQTFFADRIPTFLAENPDINLELTLHRRSLALGEVELQVTQDPPIQGNLIRQRVARMRCDAYAHERFTNNLTGWIAIGYSGDREAQYFRELYGAKPRVAVEGLNLCAQILADAPMTAILPRSFAESRHWLVPINGKDAVLDFAVWMSFHASRRLDPRVEIAKRFILESAAGTE